MANICLYKIKVRGRKRACYALVDMMPLYSWEKEYLSEEGTEDDFELIFLGACKWSVDCYTTKMKNPVPFTEEELNAVGDGDHWDKTLKDKSVLLDCEIWCNSKDIDACGCACYEHYNRGKEVNDETPKELHIKRGRDYDFSYEFDENGNFTKVEVHYNTGRSCKVKFESGAYNYSGNCNVGDIVKVAGAKAGCIGRVIEIQDEAIVDGLYAITEHLGHVEPIVESDIEAIWKSHSPPSRKEYLVRLGLDEKATRKKFVSFVEYKWTVFSIKNKDWGAFIDAIRSATLS